MNRDMRIASRREGDFVNFYFAGSDMKDALLLMSVRLSIIDVVGWEYFRDAAVKTATKGLESVGATAVGWETTPAPEHERSGRG